MPELPEVETTVQALRPLLVGRRIAAVSVSGKSLRQPLPPGLASAITGARVMSVDRRAKYGLIATDRGESLIFHLGMSGRWLVDPDPPSIHDHLTLTTDADRRLVLRDPRRFGQLELVPTKALDQWAQARRLGVEPLSPAFTPAALRTLSEGRLRPIKSFLLDQAQVAGLGNIYVCEALAVAGIAPDRPADTLSPDETRRLVKAVRNVLRRAIVAGGSSFSAYAHPDGQLGNFARDWRVYGREGQACRCGGVVARRVDSGRSTFWCPTCQK